MSAHRNAARLSHGYEVMANGDILVFVVPKLSQVQKLRLRLWLRDPCCVWCGLMFVDPNHATLEHLQFKSRGGGNTMRNCRLACFKCNGAREKWYTRALRAKQPKSSRSKRKVKTPWPESGDKAVWVRGAWAKAVVY